MKVETDTECKGLGRLALAVVCMGLAGLPVLAGTATHSVCAAGCDFTSIAAAVAAAAGGDHIVIEIESPQVHTESSVVIEKNLTLRGLGRERTIVQAAPSVETATTGILNVRNGASVFLEDLTLRHGNAGLGGAVLVEGASGFTTDFTVSRVRFENNRASGFGGALFVDFFSVVNITDSVFESNTADYGGGFASSGGDLSLRESLVVGNSAEQGGGGYHSNGDLVLWNTTITQNHASALSGGLHIPNSVPVIRHVTLVDNSAPDIGGLTFLSASVVNTVIANNPGGDCSREITGFGPRNWDSDGSCGPSVVGTGDPKLEPLRDNFGPTWTLAPQEESPLLDSGQQTSCAAFDQRGLDRSLGGDCDIGAYERYEIKTCESPNVEIPDDTPSGFLQTVALAAPDGAGDRIIDVNASLFVLHPWVGDLAFELSHDGVMVPLLHRPGVPVFSGLGCNQDDLLVSLDDSAALPAEHQCSTSGFAIGGRFQPLGSLKNFRDRGGNGFWSLVAADLANGLVGTLLSWCVYVELFDAAPEPPVFADNFEGGHLSSWSETVP